MKNIIFSISVICLTTSSSFGQFEEGRFFLNVNHFHNLFDDHNINVNEAQREIIGDEDYLTVLVPSLHSDRYGTLEFDKFKSIGFEVYKATFKLDGEFHSIRMKIQKTSLNGKTELYEAMELLNSRFRFHVYTKNGYVWVNNSIAVTLILQDNGLYMISRQRY